jgi:hypothetical protein
LPPGGGAKLAEVRGKGFAGLAGTLGLLGVGLVEGVGLGCEGGMGGSGVVSGGRWTAQALNPRTMLSRVIRAMAVM